MYGPGKGKGKLEKEESRGVSPEADIIKKN